MYKTCCAVVLCICGCRYLTGWVPQDDLLHETLTVRENLSYAATLRLPRCVWLTCFATALITMHDVGAKVRWLSAVSVSRQLQAACNMSDIPSR